MKLQGSDLWVLISICACGRKGGTIRWIIGVGDYINHAVMTKDELFGGLKRLHGAGLIFQKEDRFFLAPRMVAAYKRIQKKIPRRYLRQWDLLKDYIDRVEKKRPIGKLGRLTKKMYDDALKDYMKGWG